MANLPQLRSKEQIIGDLVDGFLARISDVNDLSRGSVITQFFNAIGQANFKAAADIIAMIDALSVDRATGDALQRLARDKNVPISPGTSASGRVNITDLSFQKVSSNVYAGQPAPVAGSLKIYVVDASSFNANGGIVYVGRTTPNVEGPLKYTLAQAEAGGAYWSLTLDTSTPTTKFHNIGETVVMGQGGTRTIQSGTTVSTASGSATTTASFKTTANATIIDGEITVSDVPVVCSSVGNTGNVPRGAITEASGLSFTGTVYNPNAFTNGTPPDDDNAIRERIKEYEAAKSNGTEQSIQAASVGVIAPDELKKVQSSTVVRYTDTSVALVFDDGTGYEPIYAGVGIEQVLDGSIGGETELQLRQRPVALARVKTVGEAPYNIPDNYTLTVEIEGITLSHAFKSTDFKVNGNATAFEVCASINGDPNIHFLASTSDSQTKVVLYPRDKTKNEIQVKSSTTMDANGALGFPTTRQYSLLLYKDDRLLYQDGKMATVSTRLKSSWSTAIVNGDTLKYKVDGTPEITATFTKEAFQEVNPTSVVNSFTDIDIWVTVINNIMTGINAVKNGETIDLSSARGADDKASLEITGGSLMGKIFAVGVSLYASGRTSDYTLNKQTAQIALTTPLLANETITAGSPFTRAYFVTTQIPDGPADAGKMWLLVDGATSLPTPGLEGNSYTTFEKTGSKITITATNPSLEPVAFDNVKENDWMLIWAENNDLINYPTLFGYQGFWRVESVERGKIVVDDGTLTSRPATNTEIIPTDRIMFARSEAPIQKLSFSIGSLSNFVSEVETQINGVKADVVGSTVRVSTLTYAETGEIVILAANSQGKALGVPVGTIYNSIPSHQAFVATSDSEVGMPSFTHSTMGARVNDTTFVEPNYPLIGGTKNDFVEFLDKYDLSGPNKLIVPESNKDRRVFVENFDTATNRLSMKVPDYLKLAQSSIQANDRYFLRTSYQFDSNDKVVGIVDGDTVTKVYTLPVARKIGVSTHSTPTLLDFSASDNESTLDINDPGSFYGFDFTNFKVWRQASAILTDSIYGIRIKSADFGPVGNKIRVGFVYPNSNTQTSLAQVLGNTDLIDMGIRLPVQTPRVANWDGTTSFTTDVTNISTGKDQVKYTHRVGSTPNFLAFAGGADVNPGDIAMINASADFLSQNRDIQAKVVAVTGTTFTVEIPAGKAVSDNVVFSSMVNQNQIVTLISSTPHGISQGDMIGLWDTEAVFGSTKPFNNVYYPKVITSTEIEITAPVSAPHAEILSGTLSANVATLTTKTPHGLYVGNIILVSGTSSSFDGIAIVTEVASTQLKYVRGSAPLTIGTGGFVDFQSTASVAGSTFSIASLSKLVGTVTVTTSTNHNFASTDIVQITGIAIDPWVNSTTYAVGDIINYSGNNYASKSNGNVGNQPDITPTWWTLINEDFTGRHVVSVTGPTTITYESSFTQGSASATGGVAVKYATHSLLARSLGSNSDMLQFGQVSTTAQEVVDYITQNLSSTLIASIEAPALGSATITSSTKDTAIATNYLNGSVTRIDTINGSRLVKFLVNVNIPAGSDILISGTSTVYDGSYVVSKTEEIVPATSWLIWCQSNVLASSTTSAVVSGTFLGSTPYITLKDGENSVLSTNLGSLIGSPMFTMKEAWSLAPTIGEEIRLLATTADQLTRFWNRLVVSGLSNVANIANSEYSRQIQITTDTFGSTGSIQITGGSANSDSVAVVGSGSEIVGKIGVFNIPFDLRKGIIAGGWIKISQTVRGNKDVNFDGTTVLSTFADGLGIVSGSGSFQTTRSTTQDASSIFKIERHGKFIAIINIGGASTGLATAGVQEGDWVKIRNIPATAYSQAVDYSIGSRVSYQGFDFYAIAANGPSTNVVRPIPLISWSVDSDYNPNDTVIFKDKAYRSITVGVNHGNYPDTTPTDWELVWEIREWNSTNQGIFKVVRTYGENSFWIENDNAIEEICYLGNAGNLTFYSYDSIMPGDTLVLSGNIMGQSNVGRYTVVDETYGTGYYFPTASRIYTLPVPLVKTNVTLGSAFNQVNIEEKNPLSLWKQVITVGPASATLATVIVNSPNLMNKITSSNAAYIEAQGKLNYTLTPSFGIDAYKYFNGLIKELNRIIYGDPQFPIEYSGVRAAGTDIDIQAALVKKITLDVSVRIRTGLPFDDIREAVKASAAGYVNSLGVGGQVMMSKVVEAISKVNGVSSVVITYPTYDATTDQIPVGSAEKAMIIDPTNDVTVAILTT